MRLIDADNVMKRAMMFEKLTGKKLTQIHDFISSEPTIEPQKWIPVSERLPEIGEYVLCSQENGDVGEGKLLDYDSWLICYDQTCRGSYWVNAWMPLPEPYKGEEE